MELLSSSNKLFNSFSDLFIFSSDRSANEDINKNTHKYSSSFEDQKKEEELLSSPDLSLEKDQITVVGEVKLNEFKKIGEGEFEKVILPSQDTTNRSSPTICSSEDLNITPNFTKIFKLPITYLKNIHSILQSTAEDLELITIHNDINKIGGGTTETKDEFIGTKCRETDKFENGKPEPKTKCKKNITRKSMYEYLFRPTHEFSKQLLPEWGKFFTSDIDFLKDTQNVILNMEHISGIQNINKFGGGAAESNYEFTEVERRKNNLPLQDTKENFSSNLITEKNTSETCNKNVTETKKVSNIINIWNTLKNDDFFLDKYGYMDWNILLHLNKSEFFLQWLTIVNLMSPITSLLIPIVLIIFPFLLLKIQQVPIDFTTYIQVLGDIAQNHFIGKMINLTSISYDKIVYMMFSAGMYVLQIYQNINFCFSFYKNIKQMKKHLYDMREYVSNSVKNMKLFIQHNNYKTYLPFIQQTKLTLSSLIKLENELLFFKKDYFNPILNAHEMGYILKMYYELYSNKEYENALLYSFGFEGYLENLTSVWSYYKNKKLNISTIRSNEILNEKPKSIPNKSTENSEQGVNEIEIKEQFYIPYIEEEPVKTDCNLKDNMIISGVNASGKTTYLKTTTLNVLFSQQIGFGCFQSMQFTPYTQIHSYLNIPDTSDRDSLFQAEARRCKNIIDIIDSNKYSRHFCIFDELYSGTNPSEASKSAYAFLLYLSKYNNVNFMITTHYSIICKKLSKKTKLKINGIQRRIRNFQTDVVKNEDGSLKYNYKLKPGVCRIQGAIEVLKNMNYPKYIIEKYQNF
jgi:hypothetical protein